MRMLRALDEFELAGTPTLLGFHKALLSHPCFIAGETCHGIVESEELAQAAEEFSVHAPPASSGRGTALSEQATTVEVDGRRIEVKVLRAEPAYRALARRRRGRGAAGSAGGTDAVVSPMQGTVLDVKVADGDEVEPGAVICIVEAMKMENEVTAHRAGVVAELAVQPGQSVTIGQSICVIAAG